MNESNARNLPFSSNDSSSIRPLSPQHPAKNQPLPTVEEIRKRKATRAKRKKARGIDYIQSTVIFNPELYLDLDDVLREIYLQSGIKISRSILLRSLAEIFVDASRRGYHLDISDLFRPDPNEADEWQVFQHCVSEKIKQIFSESLSDYRIASPDRSNAPAEDVDFPGQAAS